MTMSAPVAKRLLKVFVFTAAVLLLALAMIIAVKQVDLSILAAVEIRVWLAFVVLVAGNLFLASLMFWVVTLSFDAVPRVGLVRMTQLVTASALLNFLPLRPGLIGRAAILRTHHNLPLRQSAIILLIILITGGLVTLAIGLAALFITNPLVLGASLIGLTVLMSVCTGPIASKILRRRLLLAWLWVPIRMTDALVASMRLWVAFWVMGHPLDARQALVAGAAGLIIAMIGLTPNGLGLKEWAIALITQAMAVTAVQVGLAATLVDRSMEAMVVIVAGLAAIVLMRRWLAEGVSASKRAPQSTCDHTSDG